MTKFADTARQAYKEAHDLLRDPEMRSVVNGGLTILYGPPIERPDLFLISFQGGGAAPVIYDTWPERLLYLDDEYKLGKSFKFGRNLCTYAREVGIYQTIKESTVAVPVVFPGAKSKEASKWVNPKSGPRKKWCDFSLSWVERLVDVAQPKAIIVFGTKTSDALSLSNKWEDEEKNHGSGSRTFGTTRYGDRGVETIYSGHLSQRYVKSEVKKSFRHAAKVAGILND